MTYMTSRAAQHCLAGRMRPAGRGLESPGVYEWVSGHLIARILGIDTGTIGDQFAEYFVAVYYQVFMLFV